MNFRKFALGVAATAALVFQGSAWAHDYKAGQIEVDDLWVRATAPGQVNGAGYMDIENNGATNDRLVAVRSGVSQTVELHQTATTNGVSTMRKVDGMEVPAHSEVKFVPGGNHVMFLNLKAPLQEGTTFPATLVFEKAGSVDVQFKVKPLGHKASAAAHHGH